MHDQLSRLVGAAKWFVQEHEAVKDNPEKLLKGERKGAEESARVSDECAASMEIYMKSQVVLAETARFFFEAVSQAPLARDVFPKADRKELEIAFAALRLVTAELEWTFCPVHSSRMKDYTPADLRATDRWEKYREELVKLVKELK